MIWRQGLSRQIRKGDEVLSCIPNFLTSVLRFCISQLLLHNKQSQILSGKELSIIDGRPKSGISPSISVTGLSPSTCEVQTLICSTYKYCRIQVKGQKAFRRSSPPVVEGQENRPKHASTLQIPDCVVSTIYHTKAKVQHQWAEKPPERMHRRNENSGQ